jgi:hypothetical protein
MYYLEEKELIDHATCDSADLIYAGITETTVPSPSNKLPTIDYLYAATDRARRPADHINRSLRLPLVVGGNAAVAARLPAAGRRRARD